MRNEKRLGGMSLKRRLGGAVACALVALVVAACGEEQAPEAEQVRVEPAPSGTVWVRGAGATFPAFLYEKWIESFQQANPDIWVTYEAIGSGGGINRFVTESVDFGASDAAMKDEDIAKVDRGVHLIPATAGMVVVAYTLEGVEGDLRLPRDVYPEIFAGNITRWNDPAIQEANPELDLPDRNIQLVTRRDSSGTTFAFTNHLNAISPTWGDDGLGKGTLINWPNRAMLMPGNEGVAQRIKISDGAIGYVGFEYATRLGLRMATLENQAGNYITPDAEAGRVALANAAEQMPENMRLFMPDPPGETSYPIVTYSWLLVYARYPDERKRAAVTDFINYGLTDGQALSDDLGFIRLPDSVVAAATQAVSTIQ